MNYKMNNKEDERSIIEVIKNIRNKGLNTSDEIFLNKLTADDIYTFLLKINKENLSLSLDILTSMKNINSKNTATIYNNTLTALNKITEKSVIRKRILSKYIM